MADEDPAKNLPPLFQPFKVRGVTFRNRIVLTPMCQYKSVDGFVNDWHLQHHARFALGGVGGAIVEMSAVTPNGRITPACLGIWKDEQIAGLQRITSLYHQRDIPIGIQVAHSGFKGSAAVPVWDEAAMAKGAQPLSPEEAWETVAPSPVVMIEGYPMPRALESWEIEKLIDLFAEAGRRAMKAGFDFVEVHGAHGYLLNSFFSPLSNRREDEWGGDLEGRMRFPLRIASALRDVLPRDTPVFYRASVEDAVEGGVQLPDTIALAKALKTSGVDVVDCSSGGINGASGRANVPQSPGYLAPYAAAVREGAQVATMSVGLIDSPRLATDIIARGNADLVAMGRGMLADPNFPFHAACELGHPDPYSLLPASYAFFLRRKNALLRTLSHTRSAG